MFYASYFFLFSSLFPVRTRPGPIEMVLPTNTSLCRRVALTEKKTSPGITFNMFPNARRSAQEFVFFSMWKVRASRPSVELPFWICLACDGCDDEHDELFGGEKIIVRDSCLKVFLLLRHCRFYFSGDASKSGIKVALEDHVGMFAGVVWVSARWCYKFLSCQREAYSFYPSDT